MNILEGIILAARKALRRILIHPMTLCPIGVTMLQNEPPVA